MSDVSAQQRLASDPKANVYVSASAGTGKTKVLSDRVLRLMLAGTSISNILCLTFTNASAWEMKERIASKLRNWLICSDEELSKELNNLEGKDVPPNEILLARSLYGNFLEHYDALKIQTIHSFCNQIINYFPSLYGAGEIISTPKKNELKERAIDYTLESELPEIIKAKTSLLKYYDYGKISDFFSNVLVQRSTFKKALELGQDIFDLYGAEKGKSVDVLLESFFASVPRELATTAFSMEKRGIAFGQQICMALDSQDFESYKLCFFTQAGKPRAKLINKSIAEQFPRAQEIFEAEIQRIDEFNVRKCALVSAGMQEDFVIFMKAVLDKYESLKAREKLLDYDDLLIGALKLFAGGETDHLLLKLDCKIDHILVDEAQDLSELQWEIIKAISSEFFAGLTARDAERTIFIVGDYKQSIYSFQGANPDVFLNVKDYFGEKVKAVGKKWIEVALHTSFRSTQPVLSVVDKIFNQPDYRSGLGGNEEITHKAFRAGDGLVALMDLSLKPAKDEENGWKIPSLENEYYDSKRVTASTIAHNIASWINNGRELLGHKRTIEPKDILILVRKRSAVLHHISSELKKLGIGVAQPDSLKIHDNIIFQDFIALFKFILLPQDDLNLACLLKSPFFNVSEDDLHKLCFGRETFLWQRIISENLTLYNELNYYLELSGNLGVLDLSLLVIDKSRNNFKKRFGNKATQAINDFQDFVRSYIQTENPSLQGLVHAFENNNESIKTSVQKQENRVRIMTVHAAKGLQSPIVILADTASTENSPHQNMFFNNGHFYFSSYKEFDTPYLETIKQIQKQKDAEESLRLLYVAMTRAEDELYVAGWEAKNQDTSWYEILKTNISVENKNYSFANKTISGEDRVILPGFLNEPLKVKFDTERIATATEPSNVKTPEMIRGDEIHHALHIISKIPQHIRQKYLDNLNKEVAKVVENNLNKFPNIFQSDTLSELPVAGTLSGRKISVRMDKVIIDGSHVKIIDFKTRNSQGTTAGNYKRQLNLYREILGQLWKDKTISTHILWLDDCVLEEVKTN